MKFEQIWNMAWIYNRLVNIYKQKPEADYMDLLFVTIKEQCKEHFPHIYPAWSGEGLIEFRFQKGQP